MAKEVAKEQKLNPRFDNFDLFKYLLTFKNLSLFLLHISISINRPKINFHDIFFINNKYNPKT